MTLEEADIKSAYIVIGILMLSSISCFSEEPFVFAIGSIITILSIIILQVVLKYIIWFIGDIFK